MQLWDQLIKGQETLRHINGRNQSLRAALLMV